MALLEWRKDDKKFNLLNKLQYYMHYIIAIIVLHGLQFFYLVLTVGGGCCIYYLTFDELYNAEIFGSTVHVYMIPIVICSLITLFYFICHSHPGYVNSSNYKQLNEIYNNRFDMIECNPVSTININDENNVENKDNISCNGCNLSMKYVARSKHCYVCNIHIARFDHHCIFLNNCIGGGNYAFFLFFIMYTSLYISYGIYILHKILSFYHLLLKSSRLIIVETNAVASASGWSQEILFLWTFKNLLCLFYFSLSLLFLIPTLYFLFLIYCFMKDMTTWELVSKQRQKNKKDSSISANTTIITKTDLYYNEINNNINKIAKSNTFSFRAIYNCLKSIYSTKRQLYIRRFTQRVHYTLFPPSCLFQTASKDKHQ